MQYSRNHNKKRMDLQAGRLMKRTTGGSRWNQTGTKETSEDTINATVRPWIGSGFGQEIRLKKITYKGRTDQA